MVCQAELHHIGPAGAEGGFAIAQVEAPQAAKTFVEPQPTDLLPGAFEPRTPFGEGARVVLAEPGDGVPLEARLVGLLAQPGFARQHPAREYVFPHEVGALAIDAKQLVPDGDDLQAGPPTWREHLAHLAEIGRPIGLTHRLEHLDRSNPVKLSLDIAIVHQPDVGLVGQALVEQALAGEVVLSLGDGHAGDAGADLARGEFGETAPAAADLQHLVAGFDADLPRQAGVFVALGFAQRLSGALIAGGGIGHAGVEPPRIEGVAEVVVGVDVAPRAALAVLVEDMGEEIHRPHERIAIDQPLAADRS